MLPPSCDSNNFFRISLDISAHLKHKNIFYSQEGRAERETTDVHESISFRFTLWNKRIRSNQDMDSDSKPPLINTLSCKL